MFRTPLLLLALVAPSAPAPRGVDMVGTWYYSDGAPGGGERGARMKWTFRADGTFSVLFLPKSPPGGLSPPVEGLWRKEKNVIQIQLCLIPHQRQWFHLRPPDGRGLV